MSLKYYHYKSRVIVKADPDMIIPSLFNGRDFNYKEYKSTVARLNAGQMIWGTDDGAYGTEQAFASFILNMKIASMQPTEAEKIKNDQTKGELNAMQCL